MQVFFNWDKFIKFLAAQQVRYEEGPKEKYSSIFHKPGSQKTQEEIRTALQPSKACRRGNAFLIQLHLYPWTLILLLRSYNVN